MTLHFNITTVALINNNSLQISFNNDWYQENISNLSEFVFEKLDRYQVTEEVLGADMQYYRFKYNKHQFILHFECYSQSCWIEKEVDNDENTMELLLKIKNELDNT